jgi:hypothetical protein
MCPSSITPYISQVSIANIRFSIPRKHRINSLGKLRATCLVDAAGINPTPLEPVGGSLATKGQDFLVAGQKLYTFGAKHLQRDLVRTPGVREDDIRRTV